MKIKKGDTIVVISGKDRGRRGKVLRVLPREERIVVEGVNMQKRHVRSKRAGQKGQTVQMPAPFSISNVKMVCGKCGKATRVGYKKEVQKQYRICKKCGAEI